jgi:hypothetical protein
MRDNHESSTRAILIARFTLDMPIDDYAAMCDAVADEIAKQPGLERKLWALDRSAGRAAGIYVFRTREAARAYLRSPAMAQLRAAPIRDLELELYEPQRSACAATGMLELLSGPLSLPHPGADDAPHLAFG